MSEVRRPSREPFALTDFRAAALSGAREDGAAVRLRDIPHDGQAEAEARARPAPWQTRTPPARSNFRITMPETGTGLRLTIAAGQTRLLGARLTVTALAKRPVTLQRGTGCWTIPKLPDGSSPGNVRNPACPGRQLFDLVTAR
ncbi:hypothetical protein [Streptomyces afghaniensis]|uniref:hypothetical protein n=1 Tax=Streptomyces afghaniensis TaxID=66865 RepID=UPI0037916903